MSETYASVSDEFGYGDNMRDELVREVVALRLQFANQAESLAASRRAVETVTRERNEAIVKLSLCKIGREEAQEQLAKVTRERDEAREEATFFKAAFDDAQGDWEKARAALEDVRRVEALIHEKTSCRINVSLDGALCVFKGRKMYEAPNLESLGRALEAGDDS